MEDVAPHRYSGQLLREKTALPKRTTTSCLFVFASLQLGGCEFLIQVPKPS